MRTLHLVIFTVALFLTAKSSAELVVYSGTAKESRVGAGQSQKITFKYYLVLDHDNANLTEIVYYNIKGVKRFSTYSHTNFHLVEISGPNGKGTMAIAATPNDCDVSEGSTSDGVFLSGATSSLAVNTNSTISFPKVLTGSGRGISYPNFQPTFNQSSIVINFNSAETLQSNENREALDAAVGRLASLLQGQGYYQQSEKVSERSSEIVLLLR